MSDGKCFSEADAANQGMLQGNVHPHVFGRKIRGRVCLSSSKVSAVMSGGWEGRCVPARHTQSGLLGLVCLRNGSGTASALFVMCTTPCSSVHL